jgi:transcriptional regulator with XRE-family HTH domain
VYRDPQHVLGRAIRKRRLDLGLSQEKLAERADLHWTYIGGIERGERNVSLMNIVKIANALKSRVSELLADLDS